MISKSLVLVALALFCQTNGQLMASLGGGSGYGSILDTAAGMGGDLAGQFGLSGRPGPFGASGQYGVNGQYGAGTPSGFGSGILGLASSVSRIPGAYVSNIFDTAGKITADLSELPANTMGMIATGARPGSRPGSQQGGFSSIMSSIPGLGGRPGAQGGISGIMGAIPGFGGSGMFGMGGRPSGSSQGLFGFDLGGSSSPLGGLTSSFGLNGRPGVQGMLDAATGLATNIQGQVQPSLQGQTLPAVQGQTLPSVQGIFDTASGLGGSLGTETAPAVEAQAAVQPSGTLTVEA